MGYGLMFHHFHDDVHPRGQGSISAAEFEAILDLVQPPALLAAEEFLARAEAGDLGAGDRCLSFDDNLKCQYDIAGPILQQRGLTAFFFPYTCVFEGQLEVTELYRRFRTVHFADTEAFYEAFESDLMASDYGESAAAALAGADLPNYLGEHAFYTLGDRRFRYLRDQVLGPERYQETMELMITNRGLDRDALAAGLWTSPEGLRELRRDGHVIGLHTHTHPTLIKAMPKDRQEAEYRRNRDILHNILGEELATASHPCGNYNADTLNILTAMGVQLAFRSNMAMAEHGPLEYPRLDHCYLLEKIAGG